MITELKKEKGVKLDLELDAQDWKRVSGMSISRRRFTECSIHEFMHVVLCVTRF